MTAARRRLVLKGADRARARTIAMGLYPQLSLDGIVEVLKTAKVVRQPDGALKGVHLARNTVRALLDEAGVPIRAPHRTRRAKAGGGEA